MKVAVVGCGSMGHIHARSYAQMAGVQLVGVCDIDAERSHSLAESTKSQAFASFEAMMEAVDAEIVSIALPTYLHKEYAIKAASLGKHVICEKPIALNYADAKEIINSCNEHGVRLFVGHVVRFFPEYADVKQKIDGGLIGRLGVAHTRRIGAHPGDKVAWFKDASKSGGVILDLMIHDIDFMRWAFGEVKSAYGFNHVDGQMDYALATLVFTNGAVANLEAHWGYPGPFRTAIEVAGAEGIVRHDSEATPSLQIRRAAADDQDTPFIAIPQSPSYRSPYDIELKHFITCIREQREPIVTAEDAAEAVKIACAVLQSIDTGKVIEL